MNEECQKLNKEEPKDITNNKIEELDYYQLSVIFLIIIIMIIFVIYKIAYIILMNNFRTNKVFDKIQNIQIPKKYQIEEENIIYPNNKEEKIITNIEEKLISLSYSKNLEDLILNACFYDIYRGFYIDIGDFGSRGASASKYFYSKGWNGINIKPFSEQFNQLALARQRDININYKIIEKYGRKFVFQDMNKKNITYNQISDVLKKYIPKNKEIHFCKIDTNKDTRKIIFGYDFKNYGPKLFCIENNSTYDSYEYILSKNNYSFIYQYKDNRYYIDNKNSDLKQRMDSIDEIIRIYKNKVK
jgi:hypothetical protein